MTRKKKIYLCVVLPIAIILAAITSYGIHIYTKAENTVEGSYEDIDREDKTSDLRDEEVNPIEDNVSVLIIGVDDSEKRDYEKTRSDTLMLATFNKSKNNVKLLSIPRDSYVYVPEVDYFTKINHAHAYGGPKATVETVENFMNVPVDYYVRVNFNAFIEVVDSLGGIMYDVPFDMSEIDTKGNENSIHIEEGYQKLDGTKALALARTRKYDSDIERGKRQQKIIKKIINQVTSTSSVFKLDNLIDAVGNNMTTNLTFDHMKDFLSYGTDEEVSIESVNLEGHGGFMDDDLWYYQINEQSRENIEDELRAHLNLPLEQKANTGVTADGKANNSY